MRKQKIALIITIIIFLISLVGSCIGGWINLKHAFCNPHLTRTQNIIWFFEETYWWIFIIVLIVSYIFIGIFGKDIK